MAGEQIVGFLQLLEQGAVTSNDGTGWCSLNLLGIIIGGSTHIALTAALTGDSWKRNWRLTDRLPGTVCYLRWNGSNNNTFSRLDDDDDRSTSLELFERLN